MFVTEAQQDYSMCFFSIYTRLQDLIHSLIQDVILKSLVLRLSLLCVYSCIVLMQV
jgi:hypothetical protein